MYANVNNFSYQLMYRNIPFHLYYSRLNDIVEKIFNPCHKLDKNLIHIVYRLSTYVIYNLLIHLSASIDKTDTITY